MKNEYDKIGDFVVEGLNYCFKGIIIENISKPINDYNNEYTFRFKINKINLTGNINSYVPNFECNIDYLQHYVFTKSFNGIFDALCSYFINVECNNYEEVKKKIRG